MFYTFQLILWVIFLLVISSKIKRNRYRILFSLVTSFFSTVEIVAVYMTEKFIDYRFYNHMNLNAIEGHGFQFISQFLLFIGLFILLGIAFYFMSRGINNSIIRHNKFFLPSTLVLFILLSVPNGIFSETYKIYEVLSAEEKDFNKALIDVGIDPNKYVTPDKLTASKGKNIIVISIESLEQGFLGKNFDEIAPNLIKLSKEWTYFNQMRPSPGGAWTAGSLYSYQVGIPAFFKGQGNDFFQGSTNVKLTGLGHILNKAGYNSKYIVGNAEFSGMADILNSYGISTVSQNEALGNYPKVDNGLHDYDLFTEAKLQIDEFKKDKKKPFALFMSTINTHFPKGIYDKRMKSFIPERENVLEFSVSAVDYLIGDFIDYLQNNNLLENTAIYIFPDHLLMGSLGPVQEKLRKSERKLYLLTNIDENKLSKNTSQPLYQIDLPRIIVDGAEIQTNANFLVDFVQPNDIDKFINNKRTKITSLNTASVTKTNYQNGIEIKVVNDNLSITSDENKTNITLPIKLSRDINISITSSEYVTSKSIKSFISVGKKSFNLTRGLNLLTVNDQDDFIVEHFDTYGSEIEANKFLTRLEALSSSREFWAIVSHDAVKSDYPNFKERLDQLNFKLLQTLNGRKAYIAYSDINNKVQENFSNTTISKNVLYKKRNNGIFDVTFNHDMVAIQKNKSNFNSSFSTHEFDNRYKRIHLIVNIINGKIDTTYLGNKQTIGIYKKGDIVNYSAEEIQKIMTANNAVLTVKQPPTKKIKPAKKTQFDPSVVSITSSEYFTSKRIPSFINAGGKDFDLYRGLNLLTRDYNGKFHIKHFDTYGSADDARLFLSEIEHLIKYKKFWAIASHDAVKSDYPNFKEKLNQLNFKLLQTLNGRTAYIAYSDINNTIKEYSSQFSLSYTILSFIKPLSKEELELQKRQAFTNNKNANLCRKDTNRFIAHAGGVIEGHKYTDSLDALNLNYKKGFRLFELDIIKTSDNIYVAAHDWKHWAKTTGYKGDLPPDRKTFKEQKIYNQYIPMDMNDINQWFKDHSDAILVTDKVNTPKDFSEKFIDKNRLMMELFTWDAVKEGINAKIKSSMPTGDILGQIKGDKIAYLKELGITDIASSRRNINNQKALLKNIKASGINIYAFHLHFDKGKDEKYVVCNERDCFYGMYADNWDFEKPLDCTKQ